MFLTRNWLLKLMSMISVTAIPAITTLAYALPADRIEKMYIKADYSTYNYKKGINYFEGNVKVDQGSTHVTADQLTTKTNSKHKIEEAIAYGINKPAHFWTTPKQNDPIINAYAKVIKFYPITLNTTLQGDVVVKQGENNFQGQLIHYNMSDQTITVPETKNGRAVLVYNPD